MACAQRHSPSQDSQLPGTPGTTNTDDTHALKLRNTYYYLTQETNFPSEPKDEPVLGLDGSVLAMVNAKFKKSIDIEGSGKLADGRVLNYIGRGPDGGVRYAFSVHPYGRGIGNCPLYPYHSVAVDPKVVPLGSVIEIKETIGMRLPDGSRHDGLWRAEDVGGAIKQDRIDLFTGTDVKGEYLDQAGITHLQALTVKVVTPPAANSCLDDQPQ